MSDQTAGSGLGGTGYATEQDAVAQMPDIEQLEQSQAPQRQRNDKGQFVKSEQEASSEDAEATYNDESSQETETKEEQPQQQDDEELFLELAAEDEGAEPVRLPVEEVLSGYRKAQDLEKQIEDLQTKAAIPPQEWDQQIMDAVNKGVQYEKTLEQIQNFIMPRQPDDQLLNPHSHMHDPDAYFAQKQEYDQRLQQYQTLQQERDRVNEENSRQSQALFAAKLEREQAKLHEFWPEIKQEAVAQQVRDDLSRDYGIDDETLDSIADHRFYALAKDALAYRKQEAAAKKAAKVVRAKPAKVIKGQARQKQEKRSSRSMTELRREPTEDRAMDALGDFLNELPD